MHKRLAFVDTLRGIAVLSVVLQHALEQIVLNQPTGSYYWAFHYALGEYFNFGRFGVVLFFFVSGFVWEKMAAALPGHLWAAEERLGRGHVVLFATDPSYRASWDAMHCFLLNALLLMPSVKRPG